MEEQNLTGQVTDVMVKGNETEPATPAGLRFDDIQDVRHPSYGYAWPIVTFLVVTTSVMICAVLFRKKMRTPTNVLLGAIAIANMLTCVAPLPILMYLFLTDKYKEYIEYDYCYVFKVTLITFPVIFHTASIWLTVYLALQRALVIKIPFKARGMITLKSTIVTIAIIYFVSIIGHICRIFEATYVPVQIPSLVEANKTVIGCQEVMEPWLTNVDLYFSMYFWARAIFIHFIPCTCLVVLNVILINAMRSAAQERKKMMSFKTHSTKKSHTTPMLIAVVCVFLLVEIPVGILIILVVVPNAFGVQIMDPVLMAKIITVTDFIILCSYPCNFVIYSIMSKKFRDVFVGVFCCKCKRFIRSNHTYTFNETGRDVQVSTISNY